jgi:CMP-N,N'-diacetyllegionaminic acid synthase
MPQPTVPTLPPPQPGSTSRRFTTLALVPARGGSKSIPRKNIADLGGRPLISYALGALLGSRSVDRCIVSTDDEEIAAVSRQFGAQTPFMRPPELARDDSPTIPVIEQALRWLEANEAYRPDYVFVVQPTEPFITSGDVDALFDLVVEKGADSGITMLRVPRVFHPFHVRHVDEEGFLQFDDPPNHYGHPTRQSDPPRFAFANLYLVKRESFLDKRQLEVGTRVGLEVSSRSAFDINTPDDLAIARVLLCQPDAR